MEERKGLEDIVVHSNRVSFIRLQKILKEKREILIEKLEGIGVEIGDHMNIRQCQMICYEYGIRLFEKE